MKLAVGSRLDLKSLVEAIILIFGGIKVDLGDIFAKNLKKSKKLFFDHSLFTVEHRKKLLYIFQQDLDPSYAHDKAQLCSSKDVDFTAPASFGPFLAVAFLNGNLSKKFLNVPNARNIPVVLTCFGPTYVF